MLLKDTFRSRILPAKSFDAHLVNDCFTVGVVAVVDNSKVTHAASHFYAINNAR